MAKILRTLSTARLLVLLGAVVAAAAAVAAIAVAAIGGGPAPAPQALDQAIASALSAPQPDGISARIQFTNNLFPSSALLGQAGSPLLTGASGRLWLASDGRGRIELQSDAGDVQIVWSPTEISVYDASSNTVYRAALPSAGGQGGSGAGAPAPPSLAAIDRALAAVGAHWTLSGAQPTDVAGQPAYSLVAAPKADGGLLASLELAWDAAHGVPLRAGVYAKGSSAPALELAVTDIAYGPVPAGDVDIAPPPGAKVVDLGTLGAAGGGTQEHAPPITGLAAVQAAAGFPVVAPDALAGLERDRVVLLGGTTAVAVYGHGLGAIALVERAAGGARPGGLLGALPTVPVGGATGHELATELGTVVAWQSGGTSFVLAGSVPAATAEAAARAVT
jgi:hypothetical protein